MVKYKIVDIDQTICNSPIDLSIEEFHKIDHLALSPNLPVIDKLWLLDPRNKYTTIYVTARCQSLYLPTHKWLNTYCKELHGENLHLLMRPLNNLKSSADFKIELLKALKIEWKEVFIWVDDDQETIDKASKEGYHIKHPNKLLSGV